MTDQVIYACFYLAAILALIPSALSWFTHGGMLQALARMMASGKQSSATREAGHNAGNRRETTRKAIIELSSFDDSLFWLVNFIVPAVASMLTGITVLVWTEHGTNVAAVITGGLAYCALRVFLLIVNLANAVHGKNGHDGNAQVNEPLGDTQSFTTSIHTRRNDAV
jgi:hypothetical protein